MEFSWRELVDWYRKSARPLPWRGLVPADPYRTWISEIMSQQSTIATLLPYYERWMQRFPKLEDLANARDDDALQLWAGLGYYSRARNVLRAARALMAAGAPATWPVGAAGWCELPGVGPYTAAAVSAIAFDEPVIPVDGNVLRVASRLFRIADPLNQSRDRQEVERQLARHAASIAVGERGTVAQALMELGAQICRPSAALTLCEVCPLNQVCEARLKGEVAEYPQPKVRPPPTRRVQLALVYTAATPGVATPGKATPEILIRQIPSGLLLEGQWELPLLELDVPEDSSALGQLAVELGEVAGTFETWGPVRHAMTRYRFEVYGVRAGMWEGPPPEGHRFWKTGDTTVLTTLTRKVLAADHFSVDLTA